MTQYMTCPSGGQFFICTNEVPGGFVGCCNTANACTPQGCGDGGLVPTGFDNTALGGSVGSLLHDQQCTTPHTFYSCNATNPPFWGCCLSNPCTNGGVCPTVNLTGAFLSNNPSDWSFFTQYNTSAGPTTTSGATQSKSPNIGAIAGGTVGGILFLAALGIGIWWCTKRKYSRRAGAIPHAVAQPEARYSAVPTLVPSYYPGSPTKSTVGSSPDPNQYSYESTPRIGSGYPSGIPGNAWPSIQGYQRYSDPGSQPVSPPAWGNAHADFSQRIVELGAEPVVAPNELPGG